jgi:hypothetical protein
MPWPAGAEVGGPALRNRSVVVCSDRKASEACYFPAAVCGHSARRSEVLGRTL